MNSRQTVSTDIDKFSPGKFGKLPTRIHFATRPKQPTVAVKSVLSPIHKFSLRAVVEVAGRVSFLPKCHASPTKSPVNHHFCRISHATDSCV
jgi:hypothetical protein